MNEKSVQLSGIVALKISEIDEQDGHVPLVLH